MRPPERIELVSRRLRLVPLEMRHAEPIYRAASPDDFRYFTQSMEPWSIGAVRAFVRSRMEDGVALAAERLDDERMVATSSFFDVHPDHGRLEIGYTWIAATERGTWVNPEMKLSMLSHAFDDLEAWRVQLKCDARNEHSQRAMSKLGAQREGTLRRHMRAADGHQRDTVMFSIVREEWPGVRDGLEARLEP